MKNKCAHMLLKCLCNCMMCTINCSYSSQKVPRVLSWSVVGRDVSALRFIAGLDL